MISSNGIYVWGAKERGINIVKMLLDHGINVSGIIDNSPLFHGGYIEGIPIIGITELKSNPDTVILGAYKKNTEDEMRGIIKDSWPQAKVLTYKEFHQNYECDWYKRVGNGYRIDFEYVFDNWLNSILSEVNFWKNQVADENGRWHVTYKDKYNVREFRCDRIQEKKLNKDTVVLDVGCGLLSQYGWVKEEEEINISGVDPLAYFYNAINEHYLDKYHVKVRPRTIKFGIFEALSELIPENTADLILVDNALDHCFDPCMAIIECMKVLKTGGVLSTQHRIDEASNECYSGLHQRNISGIDGEFIIWNKDNYINISRYLNDYVDSEVHVVEEDSGVSFGTVICNFTKKREIPDTLSRHDYYGIILKGLMKKLSDYRFAREMMDVMNWERGS